jgi:CHAT domain-containing protein/tetratricopeptide (TPR) repeat protein
MKIGESIRTLSLYLVACLQSISFLVFFLNSANSYAQEGCYDVQVKLSEKMVNRLKKQITPQDTYNELSKEYLSYFSDDRFEEAKEVADALIVLSSCINKSNPISHAAILVSAGVAHNSYGDLDGAEQSYASAAAIYDQQTGIDNPEISKNLSDYAILLAKRGKHDSALIWFLKAENHAPPSYRIFFQQIKAETLSPQSVCLPAPVKLSEKMSTRLKIQSSPQDTFNQLIGELKKIFQYQLFEEEKEITDAMVVLSSCLNKYDRLYHANILVNAVKAHYKSGDLDGAEQIYASAATILDQQPGSDNTFVEERLSQYAVFLAQRGKRDEALIWFAKAEEHASPSFKLYIQQLKAETVRDSPTTVGQTLEIANLKKIWAKIETLKNESHYAEAVPLADEAIAIVTKVYGSDSRKFAYLEINLAIDIFMIADYEKSERMYSHGLGILSTKAPINVFELEKAKIVFASQFLVARAGKFAEAEKIYRDLVESRRLRGELPLALAGPLGNIAGLRDMQGDPEEAEQINKEVLAILESSSLGKNCQQYAASLNNLAALYRESFRLDEAIKIQLESISILEQLEISSTRTRPLGFTDPTGNSADEISIVNTKLSLPLKIKNLAQLYADKGDNAKAEELYKKSIKLMQELGTVGDINLIIPRAALVDFLIKTGKFDEVPTLIEQNIKTVDKYFPGKDNKHNEIMSLGELDMAVGRNTSAAEYFEQALKCLNTFPSPSPKALSSTLTSMGINQIKMKHHSAGIGMLVRAMEQKIKVRDTIMYTLNDRQKLSYLAASTDTVAQLLAALPGGSSEDITKAFNLWLRWKGGLYETQHVYFSLGNAGGGSITVELFNRLKDISRQLSIVYLQENFDEKSAGRILALEKEKEDIETRLTKSSRQFSNLKRGEVMSSTDLDSLLAGSSAYIDVAKIPGYDFKTMKFGPDQYYAFVRRNKRTTFVSLGESAPIDLLVRKFQAEFRRASANNIAPRADELRRLSRSINSLVFDPLKAHLPAGGNLYISPDGDLNLIPFEVLEDSEGKQLLDRFTVSYATTGPDLVRAASAVVSTSKEVTLIADPDYDGGATSDPTKSVTLASRDLRSLHFSRLPETATEVRVISGILAQSGLTSHTLTGQQANDQSLYGLDSPRILHIATHGFFLKSLSFRPKNGQPSDGNNVIPAESPLVRSGLALAGANLSLKQGGATGLATVGKLFGLRLAGTDLVVLSACNTGVGDIEAGEGVFGLKRAISLAGARSIITSLWSVPSDETVQLMTTFYSFWTGGKTKAKALQEAKLSMRSKNANPYYWGAFTLSGARE